MNKNIRFRIHTNSLIISIVLTFICAKDHNINNDVQFDFNRYYKVIIPSNQTTNNKMVELYNPHVWPGPDDSLTSTTPTSQTIKALTESSEVRRSSIISKNRGYGYEHNMTHQLDSFTNKSDRDMGRGRGRDRQFSKVNSENVSDRHNGRYPPIRRVGLEPQVFNESISVGFRCAQMKYYGYYADIETNCRIFHVCTPDGRQISFICPNKLSFNQRLIVCDWSHNVECELSSNFYETNLIKFNSWNTPTLDT